MYRVLPEHFGGERVPPGFHRNTVPPEYADWFTWTIVRNPYARAVSIWWSTTVNPNNKRYCYKELGTTDFATFLRYLLGRPAALAGRSLDLNQSAWLRPVRLDRIVKLESLPGGLEVLPFWRSGITLPWLNASDGRGDWRQYIDDTTGPLIREWAGDDFDRYGYSQNVGE